MQRLTAKWPIRDRVINGRNGRIAQLVEQLTLNQRVHGSSPCASTIPLLLVIDAGFAGVVVVSR